MQAKQFKSVVYHPWLTSDMTWHFKLCLCQFPAGLSLSIPTKMKTKKKLLRTKPEEEEEALFLVATFH